MLPGLPRDRLLAQYRRMLLILRFKEGLVLVAKGGHSFSHFHLYIGQETIGVPALSFLAPDDHIATTHRNHGHLLARGTGPGRLLVRIPRAAGDADAALKRRRPCLWDPARGYEDTPVYDGSRLAAGHVPAGPAVIEERTTTVVVPASFTCRVDRWRNYILSRR